MKKFLVIMFFLPALLFAEDYQYQYFAGEKDKGDSVPFSDYNYRIRRHFDTVAHYVEDYYLLYGMKQLYDENSLRMNILRLKEALGSKFRHPSKALVKVESEDEYYRYRNLMFMHINMLLCRDHLKIALRYDKPKIYFYDAQYADVVIESLEASKLYYSDALPYWNEAKKYAQKASKIKITTELSYMETERFRIMNGDIDMAEVIRKDIAGVNGKIAQMKGMLAKNDSKSGEK